MVEIFRYHRQDGVEPFTEWLSSIRDKIAQARIRIRLRQIEAGNLGDCKSVGEGVIELRVHVGAGYRVYCGQHGKSIVILLSGVTKVPKPRTSKKLKNYGLNGNRGKNEQA